jgi:hypothetical protein
MIERGAQPEAGEHPPHSHPGLDAGTDTGAAPEQTPAGETADLLTIGLLVFFVALLLTVAALLLLPVIFG